MGPLLLRARGTCFFGMTKKEEMGMKRLGLSGILAVRVMSALGGCGGVAPPSG